MSYTKRNRRKMASETVEGFAGCLALVVIVGGAFAFLTLALSLALAIAT
ncbi:hypothetical protein [Streptosporangium sp. OZ121]